MDTDKMKEAIERSDDDRSTEMSDTEKLEEALGVALIENAEPASPLGIIRDAARLVLAAQSAPGEVEAAVQEYDRIAADMMSKAEAAGELPAFGDTEFKDTLRAALLAAKLHGGTGESGAVTQEMIDAADKAYIVRIEGGGFYFDMRPALEAALASRSSSAPQVRDGALREVVDFIETWICNAVGSYSVAALDGLFAMTRDRIAAVRAASLPPSGAQVTREDVFQAVRLSSRMIGDGSGEIADAIMALFEGRLP